MVGKIEAQSLKGKLNNTYAVVPEGIVIDENYVHTDNNYTNEEKEKLAILENYDDTKIKEDIEKNTNDILEVTNDVSSISNEITTIENEITGITTNINEIAQNVDKNSQDITKNTQDINNINEALEGIDTELALKADKTEIPDVSGFIKNTVNDLVNYYKKTETYTQKEVNDLVGAIKTVSMKIVPEKPTTGETNIIYLIPSKKSETENIYDEYIYVNNKWELIGSTAIDLSNVYTKEEINTILFDYITSNDLEEILNGYVKAETLDGYVKTEVLDDYAKEEELNDYVKEEKFNALADKVADIELFKFPNAIIHGEPTINNGQVSGFSSENYLSLPSIFNLHERGFEFNFAFRTSDNVTTAQNILGSRFCMALLIENKKIKLRVSSNGTSWNLVDIEGNIEIQPNTTYYIQIYYDRLTYKLKYSLDNEEYTEIASRVASTSPYPAQIYLGIGNNFFNPFSGIINLNKCNLKVNNSILWQGMDDVGLATRMATDMSNIDETGIQFIKDIISENPVTANTVSIEDASEYFISDNVEGALNEIGALLKGVEEAIAEQNEVIE